MASLVAHRHLNILLPAAIPLVVWAVARFTSALPVLRPDWLLVSAAGLVLYAAWKWLGVTRPPEVDIRVDLLLIWAVPGISTAWSL